MSNLPANNQPAPYYPPKNIPIEVLIDYNAKGLKIKDIAKLVGCSESNVSDRLANADYNPQYLQAYKQHRADLLAHYQSKLLIGLSDDIKKMAPRDKVLSFGILYDKERLERGQATEITSFEGLPDDGLNQKITGLLERASRIGIRVSELVGELPADVRDKVPQDGMLSLADSDNNGCSGK